MLASHFAEKSFLFPSDGAGRLIESMAPMRPWPMSSSRAWLSLMLLKAVLSSRAPSGSRPSASRMPMLFQCSSIATIFIVMSFRVQVPSAGRGATSGRPGPGSGPTSLIAC